MSLKLLKFALFLSNGGTVYAMPLEGEKIEQLEKHPHSFIDVVEEKNSELISSRHSFLKLIKKDVEEEKIKTNQFLNLNLSPLKLGEYRDRSNRREYGKVSESFLKEVGEWEGNFKEEVLNRIFSLPDQYKLISDGETYWRTTFDDALKNSNTKEVFKEEVNVNYGPWSNGNFLMSLFGAYIQSSPWYLSRIWGNIWNSLEGWAQQNKFENVKFLAQKNGDEEKPSRIVDFISAKVEYIELSQTLQEEELKMKIRFKEGEPLIEIGDFFFSMGSREDIKKENTKNTENFKIQNLHTYFSEGCWMTSVEDGYEDCKGAFVASFVTSYFDVREDISVDVVLNTGNEEHVTFLGRKK